jgi:hypothetical protein
MPELLFKRRFKRAFPRSEGTRKKSEKEKKVRFEQDNEYGSGLWIHEIR